MLFLGLALVLMKLKVLMTRTSGLPKEFLVKCFISGLKKAIKKKNSSYHVSIEHTSLSHGASLVTTRDNGDNSQGSQGF